MWILSILLFPPFLFLILGMVIRGFVYVGELLEAVIEMGKAPSRA